MPAVRKEPPPGERTYNLAAFRRAQLDADFEIANDSGKVRCTVCLANYNCEPWIHRSSATAHTKSERHNRSVVAERRRAEEAAKVNERQNVVASETEKLFSDSFIPADSIPSIQVTRNEPRAVSSQLQSEEEEEMMRKVLRHFNAPQKDDPSSCPIHAWQRADQSLEAQVAQVVAGNLAALGPDTGEDDLLANVMSTACLSIPLRSPRPRVIDHSTTPDSQLPVDEVEHLAFGKSLPDKGTEWYPYKSKTVRLSHPSCHGQHRSLTCECQDVPP